MTMLHECGDNFFLRMIQEESLAENRLEQEKLLPQPEPPWLTKNVILQCFTFVLLYF
jgi:hypothetical protein